MSKLLFSDAIDLNSADFKAVYDWWSQWARESPRAQVVQMAGDNVHLSSAVYQACSDDLIRRDQTDYRRSMRAEAKKAWSESTPTERRIMAQRRNMPRRAKYARF